MFEWMRIPAAEGALTASADTTETQIGTGIAVPTWAKSIIAVRILHRLITLTTDEEVCGYLRLISDNGKIDPFYMPLPIAQCLTGAIGVHAGVEPIVLPVELPATSNDTIRAYSAYDAATTGVHTMMAYLLFSSRAPRFVMHADRSGVQTQSTSSVTAATTAETINTIEDKISAILGVWGYIVAGGGITAAQSCTGFVKVKSSAAGWLEQNIPLNIQPSGLSTGFAPPTKPVLAIHPDIYNELRDISGVTVLPFPDLFPLKGKQGFDFVGYTDGANTAAPTARFGLIYKE